MGRLRLHRNLPANEVQRIEAKSEKKSDEVQEIQYASVDSKGYPIKSRGTKDSDLPFIPSVEVKKYDGVDGRRLFIVVDHLVLDCTSYIGHHPGGASIIQGFGGQDCSWQWWTFHNRKVWNDVLLGLRVGRTEGAENSHERPSRAFVGLRGFGWQEGYA